MNVAAPLAIDIFCGLGGWTEGFLAEGYRVTGFDIERHRYRRTISADSGPVKRPGMDWNGSDKPGYRAVAFNDTSRVKFTEGWDEYPAQLVLQDVLTIHGSQFQRADIIVASPPCQEYSYMAMPWSRAKQIAAALRGRGEFPEGYTGSRTVADLNRLFDACFRIQREACEAAGRHIPMVVENVKGAQPWIGKAKANFGSFYLWGDVESIGGRIVRSGAVRFGTAAVKAKTRGQKFNPDGTEHGQGFWFAVADSKNRGSKNGHLPGNGSWFPIAHGVDNGQINGKNPIRGEAIGEGRKVPGFNFHQHENGQPGGSFQSAAVRKQTVWFNDDKLRATKCGGDWFGSGEDCLLMRSMSSKSSARKAASAQIAKIPAELSRHIARIYKPDQSAASEAECVSAK